MVAWFCAARSAAGFGALLDMVMLIDENQSKFVMSCGGSRGKGIRSVTLNERCCKVATCSKRVCLELDEC